MKLIFIRKIFPIFIILFIFCEFFFQIYYFLQNKNVSTLYSYLEIKDNFYILKPNVTIVQPERYGDIIYTSNDQGFRDRNRIFHKNDSDYRIICLGDSVTFGLGTPQPMIYSNILENMFSTQSSMKVEVINLSMPGYGGLEQTEVMNKIGFKYKPDLLILQFYMNDFLDCLPKNNKGIFDKMIALKNILVNKSLTFIRLRQLYETILFKTFHELRRKHFINTLDVQEPTAVINYLHENKDNSDIVAFNLIKKLYIKCKENNIELLVLMSPREIQLYRNDFNYIDDRTKLFLQSMHINYIDLLKEFNKCFTKEKVFNDQLHYSPEGHEIVANILYCYFGKRLF